MKARNLISAFSLIFLLLATVALAVNDWSAEPATAETHQDDAEVSGQPQPSDPGSRPLIPVAFEEEEGELVGEEEWGDEDEQDGEADDNAEEEEEEEVLHLEIHRRHLEVEMAEMETNFARLELVGRIAEIADSDLLSAAYGITHVMEFVEEEGQIIAFLTDALEATEHPGVRRLIRMKLAEVYAERDQPEGARDQLRALIVID